MVPACEGVAGTVVHEENQHQSGDEAADMGEPGAAAVGCKRRAAWLVAAIMGVLDHAGQALCQAKFIV